MQTAKSARMLVILGASLTATVIPKAATAGIDSSSALGIDSSSALGIDSSSALGIDSSSALGIDSSSALGIDSSSALGIDSSSALGIDSSSVKGADSINSPMLGGPVQSLSYRDGTIVAVGQTVVVTPAMMSGIEVGSFVFVEGRILSAGTILAASIEVLSEQYTPGASRIFVTGIPSYVDQSMGTAKIGGLTIDYTPTLGTGRFDGIGAAISVYGTQPAPGGLMLSEHVIDMSNLFFRIK